MKKVKNNVLFLLYTVILGAIVGAIVWAFLRIMNLGIEFIWDYIPSNLNFPLYALFVCVIGGLLIGVWKKKFGDYPEELSTVMGKVKKTGRYQYNNVFSTIGSALFPLLIGASVGPEAGLTGVIAGLCTWVGDKLKLYLKEVEELTQIGLSATLGTIFHSPMFGFIEPIESDKEVVLPRTSKIVLYFAAILSSFGVFFLLGKLFGGRTGLEDFEASKIEWLQYLYAIPLAAVGIAAGYLYFI
ncbi:MAG: chloride channel protein, partial [Ruminococcus sp.]